MTKLGIKLIILVKKN